MTTRKLAIAWQSEMRPHALPSPEPPAPPFTVTHIEITQKTGVPALVMHIWYAAIPDVLRPAVQENTDYLARHGNDMIPVRLIDLFSAVARMEQVSREPDFKVSDLTHKRIFTCDLPRLRYYLPDGALAILEEEVW